MENTIICNTDPEEYGIIPIAGNASRIKNIPKYLLPTKNQQTLLDHIIDIYKNNGITQLYAGVSEYNNYILQNNIHMNKMIVNTKTMAETVSLLIKNLDRDTNNQKYILLMPDTYFNITNEIREVKHYLQEYQLVLVCWKIKDYQIGKVGQCKIVDGNVVDVIDKDPNCDYPYFWGIIAWSSNLNKYINPEWQTIGDLIKQAIQMGITVKSVISSGDYYDCGTFDEYFTMIKNEL